MIENGLMADPVAKEIPWDGIILYPEQLKTEEQREIYARLYSDYPSIHSSGGLPKFHGLLARSSTVGLFSSKLPR